MKVYAFYDSSPSAHPEQAEFIRLWALSWERRGFQPRLLTARHAHRSKFYAPFVELVGADSRYLTDPRWLQWFALHAVRGTGWLTSCQVINFSLKPKRARKRLAVDFHLQDFKDPGCSRASRKGVAAFVAGFLTPLIGPPGDFQTFPSEHLARFEHASQVLTCGRTL